MKKVVIVISILILILIPSVNIIRQFLINNDITKLENIKIDKDKEHKSPVEENIENMKCEIKKDKYGDKIIQGIFINPSKKNISYLELRCILYKKNNEISENFTSYKDIYPGEKRKIEIKININEDFDNYKISVSGYIITEKINKV